MKGFWLNRPYDDPARYCPLPSEEGKGLKWMCNCGQIYVQETLGTWWVNNEYWPTRYPGSRPVYLNGYRTGDPPLIDMRLVYS